MPTSLLSYYSITMDPLDRNCKTYNKGLKLTLLHPSSLKYT